MARMPNLHKMSYTVLVELRADIESLLAKKQADEKAALKQKLSELAKAQGFELDDVLGKASKRGKVPVKYRDPENSANTWTGRGRMPRWLAAATKKRGVTREDFLI